MWSYQLWTQGQVYNKISFKPMTASSLSERTESGQTSRHATERVLHGTGRDD